jgi:two-component system, NtrC family, sensor histidine kinase HydH
VLVIAMGFGLVWMAWNNARQIEAASEQLVKGQASRYLELLFAMRGDDSRLPAMLEEQAPSGLRYVALIRDGKVAVNVGQPLAPVPDLAPEGGTRRTTAIGTSFRTVLPPPPPPPGMTTHGKAGPPAFVVDFEPLAANQLAADARRSIVLSIVVASGIVVIAFLFWRAMNWREQEEDRMVRERHLAELGGMSAVLAHEIRNPLASLKGHAQLLVEQLDPESRPHKKAQRIVSEAERIEKLSTALLDFVRSGSIEKKSTSPGNLVTQTAEKLAPGRVDVDDSKAPKLWKMDSMRMEQVVTNLLSNAVQASPEGAHVSVDISGDEEALSIRVRDQGEGIQQGEEERIFEPFHTTRARGVGLGLSVSRRIVEMHGGTIQAENHPEGGAVFHVRIPR